MTESMIMLQGYVGSDPTLRKAGEHWVAGFRMACTPRRFNRGANQWYDGPTQWYTVNAWRALGENVKASLSIGDAIFVHGRLVSRPWTNRDGVEVPSFEVEALVVGHDLNRGRSVCVKTPARTMPATASPEVFEDALEPENGSVEEAVSEVTDPWLQPTAAA